MSQPFSNASFHSAPLAGRWPEYVLNSKSSGELYLNKRKLTQKGVSLVKTAERYS